MPKICITADVHLMNKGKKVPYGDTVIGEKLEQSLNSLDEFFEYGINNLPKGKRIFAILGDVNEKKHIMDSIALVLFQQIIEKWINEIDHLYMLTGNHDMSDYSEHGKSILEIYEQYENIEVIKYNETLFVDNMIFMGWYKDFREGFQEIFESIDPEQDNILLSHFGVSEAVLSNNHSVKTPFKFSELKKAFKLMILGHYHKPQLLEDEKNGSKLYYCGSVYQKDFGERGEDKRFLVLDSETLEVESVPYSRYHKHFELDFTEENIIKYQELEAEGHQVRFVTSDPEERTKLNSMGYRNRFVRAKGDEVEASVLKLNDQKDPYESWIEMVKPDIDAKEKEEYLLFKNEVLTNG